MVCARLFPLKLEGREFFGRQGNRGKHSGAGTDSAYRGFFRKLKNPDPDFYPLPVTLCRTQAGVKNICEIHTSGFLLPASR
jgi:hypothetical protein